MILCNFRNIRPRHNITQQDILSWLALAHARAERQQSNEASESEEAFLERIQHLIKRYGCSPDRIETRGAEISDFTHTNWDQMELFHYSDSPYGPTMSQRSSRFKEATALVCQILFPETMTAPDHIIHVTCTGYISPSCVQVRVAQNRWHETTTVTHAYHMGCNAALPAIRMAEGFLAKSNRADIFHTELCSLHVQVQNHSPEQLVVQSLFADGFITYSALRSIYDPGAIGAGLEAISLHEELIPETADAITWECSEWGMRMGLSLKVPGVIADALLAFVKRLCLRGGISYEEIYQQSIFAVHPGGPKIIDQVQTRLGLDDDQLAASRLILKTCGNMSSATLPHIWEKIVADENIAANTFVISLAFGPGLCISGALLRKVINS